MHTTWIRQFFAAPVFGNEAKTRNAVLLHTILVAGMIGTVVYAVVLPLIAPGLIHRLGFVAVIFCVLVGLHWLMRHGHIRLVSIILSLNLWVLATVAAATSGGVRTPGYNGYIITILICGLLLGGRCGIGMAGLSVVAGLGLLYAEKFEMLPSSITHTPVSWWVAESISFCMAAVLVYLSTHSAGEALERAGREIAERKRVEGALRENEARYRAIVEHQTEFITRQKQAEEALQAAEIRFRTLVEQLPAITYTLEYRDEDSKTSYISPQVESILGFSQDEWLAGEGLWRERLHPADREHVLAEVSGKFQRRESLNLEYRLLARDERVVWFRNLATLIQDETGQPRSLQGLMFDITEQKRLEEQLRQAQKMEAVGQLAGGIAHNFNNMLTAIMGYTGLAMEALPVDHPARGDLIGIQKTAQRAADLTRQLLAFTRRQITYPKVFNLNDLVLDMKTLLRQLITETIELVILPRSKPSWIKADPNQIEQVLMNLVVNARDAMPHGGRLTIELSRITVDEANLSQFAGVKPGCYALVAVSDTGIGMPENIKEHIFEPFFTTKEVGQGTGLGLATCFGIIKQNNGHILVDSEVGRGTTFRVYLPSYEEMSPG
jgi:PAS domain S-box-containing protein